MNLRSLKVLFVTIAWPEKGDRNLYSDLMHKFKEEGHEVFVAHADEKNESAKLQEELGIQVLRFPTPKIRKAGKIKKAFSLVFLGYKFKKIIGRYYSAHDFDLILGNTPPITLSGLMKHLKTKYNAFFYLLLKDIWPHSSVDLGIIRTNSIVYYFFRWHEKRMYKAADKIGCMSPENVKYVIENNGYLNSSKVEVCPNTITPREIATNKNASIRNKYNIPADSTLFIFSGNLSKGHGLGYYLDVIEKLTEYHKAYFAIGGSGTYYDFLEREIQKRGLDNIFFYHWLPSEDFDQLLSSSDVGVILLDSKYTVPQFPSRLLAYLEAGKPVLCAVNEETDIGDIVEEFGCGISTIHGDIDSLISAIKRFSENEAFREKCSENAIRLLEEKYTSNRAYKIIINNLN